MGRPAEDPRGAVGGRQRAAPEHRRAAHAGHLAAEYTHHTSTRFISILFRSS